MVLGARGVKSLHSKRYLTEESKLSREHMRALLSWLISNYAVHLVRSCKILFALRHGLLYQRLNRRSFSTCSTDARSACSAVAAVRAIFDEFWCILQIQFLYISIGHVFQPKRFFVRLPRRWDRAFFDMKIVENIEVQIREVLSGPVRDNHANLTSYSRGVHTAQIYDDLCIVHCCRGRTFSTVFCACQRCRLQRKSTTIHSMDSTKARCVYSILRFEWCQCKNQSVGTCWNVLELWSSWKGFKSGTTILLLYQAVRTILYHTVQRHAVASCFRTSCWASPYLLLPAASAPAAVAAVVVLVLVFWRWWWQPVGECGGSCNHADITYVS